MLIIVSILALILSITIHEFSHALIADRLGDPTPRANGRLTLNPLAHADPLGTILLPLISALTSIPTIGWAKPVPIDPYNLARPRRDEILISIAGPLSNLFMAVLFTVLLRTILPYQFMSNFILINVSLAIFNLIPIWPLDGSKILLNLLPPSAASQWEEILSRYSLPLLLIALFLPINGSNLLSIIMTPLINLVLKILITFPQL